MLSMRLYRWYPPNSVPKEKKLWANLQRIVEKRDRTGKKGVGWHSRGGDHEFLKVKAIKSDSDSDSDEQKKVVSFWEEEARGDTAELATRKRGRQVFQEKNRGVTPSVATPGVSHPSDATESNETRAWYMAVHTIWAIAASRFKFHAITRYYLRYY